MTVKGNDCPLGARTGWGGTVATRSQGVPCTCTGWKACATTLAGGAGLRARQPEVMVRRAHPMKNLFVDF